MSCRAAWIVPVWQFALSVIKAEITSSIMESANSVILQDAWIVKMLRLVRPATKINSTSWTAGCVNCRPIIIVLMPQPILRFVQFPNVLTAKTKTHVAFVMSPKTTSSTVAIANCASCRAAWIVPAWQFALSVTKVEITFWTVGYASYVALKDAWTVKMLRLVKPVIKTRTTSWIGGDVNCAILQVAWIA